MAGRLAAKAAKKRGSLHTTAGQDSQQAQGGTQAGNESDLVHTPLHACPPPNVEHVEAFRQVEVQLRAQETADAWTSVRERPLIVARCVHNSSARQSRCSGEAWAEAAHAVLEARRPAPAPWSTATCGQWHRGS